MAGEKSRYDYFLGWCGLVVTAFAIDMRDAGMILKVVPSDWYGIFNGCVIAGVTPRSGWAVDPFGHSATMPYLLKRANITSMLIQRVHYSIKKHFSATRSLEFMWRQAWGK